MGVEYIERKHIKIIIALFLINISIFMVYLVYTERFQLGDILPNLNAYTLPAMATVAHVEERKIFMGKKIFGKYVSRINYDWLAKNPIYSNFKIKQAEIKKHVTVLVIVSSAPRRVDRRNAIRKTWWKLCKQTGKVLPECIFMTDYLSRDEKYYNITQEESKTYGDMYFQHVPGGVTFGLRFLNHMVFAVSRYKFDYFLRVDDDYFLCLKNFLNEIPLPALRRFHWGWVHCSPKNIIRPEESMLLLSSDLIETFLLQDPQKMWCHPWADQMIGLWSNTINLKRTWRHDNRLWHDPPARDVSWVSDSTNICHQYMGLHGAYPEHMIKFWKNRGKYKNTTGNLVTHSHICPVEIPFRWDGFGDTWRYEPKLCITNPKWDTSKQTVKEGSYTGREHGD